MRIEAWFWYWVIRLGGWLPIRWKVYANWRLFALDPDGLSARSDEEGEG